MVCIVNKNKQGMHFVLYFIVFIIKCRIVKCLCFKKISSPGFLVSSSLVHVFQGEVEVHLGSLSSFLYLGFL